MPIMPPLDPRSLIFKDSHGYATANNNAPGAKPRGGLNIALQPGRPADDPTVMSPLGANIAIEPAREGK